MNEAQLLGTSAHSPPSALDGPDPAILFDDGILRVGGRWIAIPEGQAPIVRLLIENRDSVVSDDIVRATYDAGHDDAAQRTVKSMMWRLRRRLSRVGIDVHKVRGRGYLAEISQHDE